MGGVACRRAAAKWSALPRTATAKLGCVWPGKEPPPTAEWVGTTLPLSCLANWFARRSTDDDAGLRAAQQLVARKRHDPCARGHAFLNKWLFRQPEPRAIQQRSRAEIIHHRNGVPFAERDQLVQTWCMGEPDH